MTKTVTGSTDIDYQCQRILVVSLKIHLHDTELTQDNFPVNMMWLDQPTLIINVNGYLLWFKNTLAWHRTDIRLYFLSTWCDLINRHWLSMSQDTCWLFKKMHLHDTDQFLICISIALVIPVRWKGSVSLCWFWSPPGPWSLLRATIFVSCGTWGSACFFCVSATSWWFWRWPLTLASRPGCWSAPTK